MAGALIDRAFAIVEQLAKQKRGAALSEIVGTLQLPASAAHRMLADLIRLGYVRQDAAGCAYQLTAKLISLSFAWLEEHGVRPAVQPALERLAKATGELVRFAIIDGDRLAWLASAQGARFGLRIEADMGAEVPLYCTAAGCAWLACLTDEEALRLVMTQGFGRLVDDGPGAPRTIDALQNQIRLARSRGVARAVESSAIGMTSLAVPVRHPSASKVLGVLDLSGPTARLAEARLQDLSADLLATAAEIGPAAGLADGTIQPQHGTTSSGWNDRYA